MIPAIFFRFNDSFVCLNDFLPELRVFTDTFSDVASVCLFICPLIFQVDHFLLVLSIVFLVLFDQNIGS